MEVIPAIDLRAGRVVRLYQGDFDLETVYSDDPVEVALRWQEAGVPRIHVVDLDGALAGRLVHHDVVKAMASQVDVPLQVGGGIRDVITANRLLLLGVQRVVLGTSAIFDPDVVRLACENLGADAVVVGVDARDGKVAAKAWTEDVPVDAARLVESMAEIGIKRFIYTDITTDGTMNGPNLEAVATLVERVDIHIISSGGIGSIADLEGLAEVGVEGVIVGSALYRGAIDLREAVERFAREHSFQGELVALTRLTESG